MNDQNLPAQPFPPTTTELSPQLRRLLLDVAPNEASDAVALIARTHALRTELVCRMPDLERAATAKAGEDGVMRVVGRRFATLGKPNLGDGEWDGWWSDYCDVLADLPESALESGMAAYVRDPASEFLPKPGRLRQLALETPNRAAKALSRACQVLAYRAPTYVSYAEKVRTPELQTMPSGERQRLAAAALAELRANRPEKPDPPAVRPNTGVVDHTGLTREMRVQRGLEPAEQAA